MYVRTCSPAFIAVRVRLYLSTCGCALVVYILLPSCTVHPVFRTHDYVLVYGSDNVRACIAILMAPT